jgi:dextranase
VKDLLPVRASFRPDEPVEVELRGLEAGARVTLWHLDEQVGEAVADSVARFGPLPEGGYGVEADGLRTAVDVVGEPFRRLRYGFVASFEANRDTDAVVENVRRLHLNAVMFYDWMYRHAELLPRGDEFDDALGRHLSYETVRRLAGALGAAGSLPIGYAAVYAVGREHREAWADEGLYRADGSQWQLGEDFLWLVDPGSDRWLAHLTAQLVSARDHVGFAGFHLDQFGWPKAAARADGRVVDLAEAFPRLIERVRTALPDARLVFNNVNDFPTWTTASAPQDAVYIEVWPPHDSLGHLGALAEKAKRLAPHKPISLAAYLSCFPRDEAAGREAMRLELAVAFSHGATCLLHGEESAVLVDPYYVRNHAMDRVSADAARAYYDFAVRYGELLFDRESVDVTRSYVGGVNEEIRVEADAPVATECVPGCVWVRSVRTRLGIVIHLIDLTEQPEVAWDAPKRPSRPRSGTKVVVERVGPAPRFLFASPESAPSLERLEPERDGRHDVVAIPPFHTWAFVWVSSQPSAA